MDEAAEIVQRLEAEVLRRCLEPTAKAADKPEGGDSLLLKALARYDPERWGHGRTGVGGPPLGTFRFDVDLSAADEPGGYTADGDTD